jgi:hypothetical protein
MKLRVLKEKIASIALSDVFLKEYSMPPTGNPELSSSFGMKGFHAVMFATIGTVANC